jgi:hypothetical protein
VQFLQGIFIFNKSSVIVVHLQKKLLHLPGFAKARKGNWHFHLGQLSLIPKIPCAFLTKLCSF